MAPVTVIDTIAPKNNANFSVAEDTYLKGGWRVAADLTARDAIPPLRRKEGMRCYILSDGKQYYLDGGIDNANWVEVTDGGGSTPMQILNFLRTQEPFGLLVDYATGTSPATDTIVHTQAEATALGTLKYIQDAFRVLPPYRDHSIDIQLAAGNQYAPSNNAGAFLVVPPITHSPKLVVDPWIADLPEVVIAGRNSVLYTGIAGTSAADATNRRYKFTRSAGTWTVDELKDKFIAIESGAGAGNTITCMGNSTTEAYFILGVPLGACTIGAYDLLTTLICDTDGGDAVSYGILAESYDGVISPLKIIFCNVGNSSTHWMGDQVTKGFIRYHFCNFTGLAGIVMAGNTDSFYQLWHCIFQLTASDYGAIYATGRGPSILLRDILFYGDNALGFIYANRGAKIAHVEALRFMPDAAYNKAVINLSEGVEAFGFAYGYVDVFGAAPNAIGLYLSGMKCGIYGAACFCFNNVATAISLLKSEISFDAAFPAPVSGTNGTGWKLQASTVRALNPATIAATVPVSMYATGTPETFAYTALAAIGDQVISSVGESLHRIG